MIYGRINSNGTIRVAPTMLIIDGKETWYPTEEQYREHGYLPVMLTNAPMTDNDHVAVCSWTETDGTIEQQWHVEEAEPTETEILSILLGGAE